MAKKPTYEELEQRVNEIEKEVAKLCIAEEALHQSEEKYRGLFDESIAAVYVFDEKKNFIDSNQAGLDLLGYSRDELLSISIPDIDADPVVVLPAHKQLLSGKNIVNYEHQLRRKDGMIITVLNNSRPLTDAEGDIIGMQSTLIDITERKEAEEALRKAHGELEQRVEERTTELAKANDQLKQEIEERKLAEKEREKLINELQGALMEIKTLRGILPLCSFCKKIRDDKGYWEQVDVYIHKHSQADISHSICPDCAKEHYPDLELFDD